MRPARLAFLPLHRRQSLGRTADQIKRKGSLQNQLNFFKKKKSTARKIFHGWVNKTRLSG